MKKLVKMISAVCAAALLSTAFVGCGSQGNDQAASTTSQGDAVQTQSSGQPVTMRFSWWGGDSRHKATLDSMEAYKKKNPNVTIQGEYGGYDGYLQKLMTQIATDSAPDLIQIDPIWTNQLGLQKDSFVDFKAEESVDLSQFDPKVLSGFCTSNGIVLGLPMGINGFGLVVNKAFMQKYNVPLDKQWSWEDIIEEGQKIHQQDKDAYLLLMDPTQLQQIFLTDYVRSKTGKFWATDDYKIGVTKEELTDAFKMMKNLFDSGAVAPFGEVALFDSKIDQYPKLINGQIGMNPQWSGALPSFKKIIQPDNFAISNAIVVKDGVDQSTTYKPSMLLSVNKKSPNAAEAVKFTNWMLNDPEAALILKDERSVPASQAAKQALIDANALDKDIAQMVDNTMRNPAAPVPTLLNNSEIAQITKDVCSKVVYGKQTPEQGAEELIKKVTDKMNALKAKN